LLIALWIITTVIFLWGSFVTKTDVTEVLIYWTGLTAVLYIGTAIERKK
jgi:hypothetical protein